MFGDSEIIVKQIRNQIHCINPHLKAYQNEVWDLLKCFNAFNIVSIPRLKNAAADLLATSAANLVPTNNQCSVELLFQALGSRYDYQPTSVRWRSVDYRMLNKWRGI